MRGFIDSDREFYLGKYYYEVREADKYDDGYGRVVNVSVREGYEHSISEYNLITNVKLYINDESIPGVEQDGKKYIVEGMSGCFAGCENLTISPKIPPTVKYLDSCFMDCTSLISVPGLENCQAIDMENCFNGCSALETIKLPNTVVYLFGCFGNCTNIIAAPVIPNNVEDMTLCFHGCSGLVGGPDLSNTSVISLRSCFVGCVEMESVILPFGAIDLCAAFEDCLSLDVIIANCTPLVNPEEGIDWEGIFDGINNDSIDIYVTEGVDSTKWQPIINFYRNKHLKTMNDFITDEINFGICDYYYSKNAGQGETFSIRVVDDRKTDFPSIEESIYGISIESMEYCFGGCINMKTAPEIPNTIKILDRCFYGCNSMTTAPIIPESIISMNECFAYCNALNSLVVFNNPSGNISIFGPYGTYSANLNIVVIGEERYYNTWSAIILNYETITMSNNFHFIYGEYHYYGSDDYVNAQVVDKTKTAYGPFIDTLINNRLVNSMAYCFENCDNITDFSSYNIPDSITKMTCCFAFCDNLTIPPELPQHLENLSYCFGQSGISGDFSNYMIPASVTDMSICFFRTQITKAPVLPNGVEDLSHCFKQCTSLIEAPDIPFQVENIGECFYGCSSLVGNINVSCAPDGYIADVFKDTNVNNNIYIINNTNPKSASVTDKWRIIASQVSNVHFEADDHTLPQATIEVTRVTKNNNTYTPSADGTYAQLAVSSKVFSQYLPEGWEDPIIVSKEVYIDDGLTPIDTSDNSIIYVNLETHTSDSDAQHIFKYVIIDSYNGKDIVTGILTQTLALLDFLGKQNPKSEYIDLPGMGMSIGKVAVRNGLDIHFPTTIGEGLLPPTHFIYESAIAPYDSSKTYYQLVDDVYIKVDEPNPSDFPTYYEITGKKVDLFNYQLAIGQFNELNNDATFIIGNGTKQEPKNIYVVDTDGNSKQEGRAEAKNITDIDEINAIVARIFTEEED